MTQRAASRNPASSRTSPTCSAIVATSSRRIVTMVSSDTGREKIDSSVRWASCRVESAIVWGAMFDTWAAAALPACRPKTTLAVSAFPAKALAPCTPGEAHSPAANRPETAVAPFVLVWMPPSTRCMRGMTGSGALSRLIPAISLAARSK